MTVILKRLAKLALVLYVFVFFYQLMRPFPEELARPSPEYLVPASSIAFFADETFINAKGERVARQEVWNEIFRMIDRAEHLIVLDMFLYNSFQGDKPETMRALSEELTAKLIAKRESHPHIAIALITDPINTAYDGDTGAHLNALRAAGIPVIQTNLGALPDSNPLYSPIWRIFVQWFGNSDTGGWLPHPFQHGGDKVTLRTWLTLANFKANHSKLIVADQPAGKGKTAKRKMVTLVTSSNPHDGSSAHGNIAIRVDDQIWKSVLSSERSIAELSEAATPLYDPSAIADAADGPVRVSFLREESIRRDLLRVIGDAREGDSITMAMFYLSDRQIVRALIDAGKRKVAIKVLLDPNKDAFGMEKNGIPNRPVAKELLKKGGRTVEVRWCDTHGEQCHAKLVRAFVGGKHYVMAGSANLTRRNIGGYNLEANIAITSESEFPALAEIDAYLSRAWSNSDTERYSADYSAYEDTTFWKTSLYRIMERTGLSSF